MESSTRSPSSVNHQGDHGSETCFCCHQQPSVYFGFTYSDREVLEIEVGICAGCDDEWGVCEVCGFVHRRREGFGPYCSGACGEADEFLAYEEACPSE